MKLRLRSVQSRETVKIEVPNSCTLQQLKETVSQAVLCASPLHLSLNRKAELYASSPEVSLQSFGIMSGDLIYFSVNPNEFLSSGQPLCPSSSSSFQEKGMSNQLANFQVSEILGQNMPEKVETLVQEDLSAQGHAGIQAGDAIFQETKSEKVDTSEDLPVQRQSGEHGFGASDVCDTAMEEHGSFVSKLQVGERQELANVEGMDIDMESKYVNDKRSSEPCFLRRVLRKELGDDGSNYKLLVIAVHAVFIESGFIGFNVVSGTQVDGCHLPEEQASKAFMISLCYTLPELLDSEGVPESIVLKFQSLGHFVNVYGCLANGGSEVYRVCLDEHKFAPAIDSVWANHKNDGTKENDRLSVLTPENEIFEFWKIIKDGLALPLSIDICEKSGLQLPSCLMRLPTELKLKIIESLPATDIARIGCVCTETRYLSSNNELWKQKFVEEFGNDRGAQGAVNWKERFALYLENQKQRNRNVNAWREFHQVPRPSHFPHFPFRGEPHPLVFPSHIIGGDHDRLPGLGIPSPFGRPGQGFPRFRTRRNFAPDCGLGGFNF